MDEINKNIRRAFWLYFALFAALAVYLAKFVLLDSKGIITSQYNPRLKLQDSSITRGAIMDARGRLLAYTNENGQRVYTLGSAAAHAVGYYNAGSAGFYGAEAKYNFELQSTAGEILQQISSLFSGGAMLADSVALTIDSDTQSFIYNQLDGYRAGAVVLEPATGKIAAMVSTPSFDPNSLAENFSDLSDDPGSPLLNRASQGKYPPGSVFKIVTAAAAMEYLPEYAQMEYNCTGEATVGGKQIRCFNSTAHGQVNLRKAFALSCNTFFATTGLKIGGGNLRSLSERFYFNYPIPYPLEYSVSNFPLSDSSGGAEVTDTSIGQGRIMASPLQIALITAAAANNGIIMKPYILDHIQTHSGKIVRKTMPDMAKQALSPEDATALTDMMTDVTEYGTGSRASLPGIKIAAKTGSAQTPNGDDHGWYTAFFPADNPRYAICIVIENIGGSARVLPIAKNIIEHLTNLGK